MLIVKTCGCVLVTLDCDKLGVPADSPGLVEHVAQCARICDMAFARAKQRPGHIPAIEAIMNETEQVLKTT